MIGGLRSITSVFLKSKKIYYFRTENFVCMYVQATLFQNLKLYGLSLRNIFHTHIRKMFLEFEIFDYYRYKITWCLIN